MTVLWLAPLPPLLLALSCAGPSWLRPAALRLAPWAAVPALALALQGPIEPQEVSWLLFGTELGIDALGRALLSVSALVWTAAGVSAREMLSDDPRPVRYWVFHLLTLAGNLTLLVAADVVSFYLGFALMTFAAYGLVVHRETPAARRAARVYLVMAILGEGAVLAGLLLASAAAGAATGLEEVATAVATAPRRGLVIALLVAGFGVKAGVLPLHVWLPLAHPVAPTPASTVLSGCMISAGAVGWLRFLPIGAAALPDLGGLLVVAGLAAAFFGAVVGIAQDDAKTVLAYSSVSQMGFLTIAVGLAVTAPAAASGAVAACAIYAVHHGLSKGALFLGVDLVKTSATGRARRLALASLVLPAAALAGAPLTSGVVAKGALSSLDRFAPSLGFALTTWLALAAMATTLVLVRFLVLVSRVTKPERPGGRHAGLRLSYLALVGAAAALGLIGPGFVALGEPAAPALSFAKAGAALAPIVAGLLVAWVGVRVRPEWRIPPGDLLCLVERPLMRALSREAPPERLPSPPHAVPPLAARWYGIYAASRSTDRLLRAEVALTRWEVAALLLLSMVAGLFVITAGRCS